MRWMGVFLVLFGLWSLLEVTDDLEVTRHRLGEGARRVTVALVSDLHIQPGQEVARKSLEALQPEPFDLLVLVGDMVDTRSRLEELEAYLRQLPPRGERFAVLGNWEYWSGVEIASLRRLYQRHGVRLLVNEAVRVPVPAGGEILLVGVDDALAGTPDFPKAMAGAPGWQGPLLILSHSPRVRDAVRWDGTQGWMVSGHTHGGQIRLFGWVVHGSMRQTPYLEGWFRGGGNLPLYVSRGVGTSIIPLRVEARPEVAFFDWGVAP